MSVHKTMKFCFYKTERSRENNYSDNSVRNLIRQPEGMYLIKNDFGMVKPIIEIRR